MSKEQQVTVTTSAELVAALEAQLAERDAEIKRLKAIAGAVERLEGWVTKEREGVTNGVSIEAGNNNAGWLCILEEEFLPVAFAEADTLSAAIDAALEKAEGA